MSLLYETVRLFSNTIIDLNDISLLFSDISHQLYDVNMFPPDMESVPSDMDRILNRIYYNFLK